MTEPDATTQPPLADRYCPGCGYNLRGQTDEDYVTCPECGKAWPASEIPDRPPDPAVSPAQWTLAGGVAAIAVFILVYRLLVLGNLYQTSAFFIGLPALLAITLALTTRAKSATGICFKATAMALLISGIFLGEGFICCVMMAPIFFIVAGLIGAVIDHHHYRPRSRRLRLLLLPAIAVMALEGVTDRLTLDPRAAASATKIVDAPPDAVREHLAKTPRFDRPMPALLQAGFPLPLDTQGQGLAVGDTRTTTLGIHGHRGDLDLAITESTHTRVRFETVRDTTKISEWLAWESATVELEPVGQAQTRVTWTLAYRRQLAPAWYFGPFQNIAAKLAASALIDNLATPPSARPADTALSPTLIRATSFFAPVLLALILSAVYRRRRRLLIGAWLSLGWAFPAVALINLAALHGGWWSFDAQGAMWHGMPVDLLLGWAVLWSVVPALLAPRLSLPVVALALLWADLLLMPLSAPVVRLGEMWQYADFAALVLVLIPAQLLSRWTRRQTCLAGRAALHAGAFAMLFLVCIPLVIAEHTALSLDAWIAQPRWAQGLWAQAFALAALPGLAAVQAFYRRGHGTPVPFDPPRALVTTGVYAYVRNPMQLSLVLMYAVMAGALQSAWLLLAAGVAFAYGLGFARWHEEQQLEKRYGRSWTDYRAAVRNWLPRWRPHTDAEAPPAVVYIDLGCTACTPIARWLQHRHPRGLHIRPASESPQPLRRMTYIATTGSPPTRGVAALAACMDHLHLGWALFGWALRLPLVSPVVQLFIDAAGGGPTRVVTPGELPR